MTTTSTYVSWNNNNSNLTNEELIAQATTFYSALESIGWAKTEDTGQLSIPALTTASLASAPYQIHYFNDSLHGTRPIYLKTRWAKIGFSSGYLGVYYSLGTGTNGSGTLTGATSAVASSGSSSAQYGGGSGSVSIRLDTTYAPGKYSGLFLNATLTDTTLASLFGLGSFFFARTVDPVTEEPNADGAVFYNTSGNSTISYMRMYYFNGSAWSSTDNYSYVPGNKTSAFGEGFAVHRHWFVANQKYQLNPYIVNLSYLDLMQDQTFTATPGAITHTYKKGGLLFSAPTYQGNNPVQTKHRPAFIWE